MTCAETIAAYAFRSIGYGERLLPRSDFTLCQQFTLIGSGMIWNIYFGVLALLVGFFIATAVGRRSIRARVVHGHDERPAAGRELQTEPLPFGVKRR